MAFSMAQTLEILQENRAEITIPKARTHTPESIRKELDQREALDKQLRAERQSFLDQAFPERMEGALYYEEAVDFDDLDF